MRSLLVLSCICIFLFSVCVSVSGSDACNGDDWGTAGEFDFYVLAESWPANFCYGHSSYPGCENPTDWQQANLTLHGLWPNYNTAQSGHDWPQCCSTKYGLSLTDAEMDPILSQLQTYWPSEQDPSPSGDWSDSLWAHEWARHGTCAGLPVAPYFELGMSLALMPSVATPSIITNNMGGSVSKSDLINYFTGGQGCSSGNGCLVNLQCQNSGSKEFFQGIETCWTMNSTQIVCPQAVIGKSTCTKTTISIDSFNNNKNRKVASF